jgi:hypothetical protein
LIAAPAATGAAAANCGAISANAAIERSITTFLRI